MDKLPIDRIGDAERSILNEQVAAIREVLNATKRTENRHVLRALISGVQDLVDEVVVQLGVIRSAVMEVKEAPTLRTPTGTEER